MSKDRVVREIEVALLRAVANAAIPSIAEAETLSPGDGIVLLYSKSGTVYRVEIVDQ